MNDDRDLQQQLDEARDMAAWFAAERDAAQARAERLGVALCRASELCEGHYDEIGRMRSVAKLVAGEVQKHKAEVARYEQMLDGSVIVTAEAWAQAQQAVEAVKRVRKLADSWCPDESCVCLPAAFRRALGGEVSGE